MSFDKNAQHRAVGRQGMQFKLSNEGVMTSSAYMPRLCVVAPCYNEENVIEEFYQELRGALALLESIRTSILFVDDGSTDTTLDILNRIAEADSSVQVISLSRNFGQQIALTAGLDAAEADAVLMMDSDLQHPPNMIPQMVERWFCGYDVVSAVRRDTKGASLLKRKTSTGFYVVFNLLSDIKLTSGAADFCLLSRRAHAALQRMPERHRLLRGMIAWIGFSRTTVPYDAPVRPAGQSKYTPAKMWGMALDAVLSFSATPIRMASRVGLFILFIAFVYFCYVFFSFVNGNTVRGWASIITLILALGGAQLIFIGLIGEYLSRVYEESKDRPLYFLKQSPGIAAECEGYSRRSHDTTTSRS
jgi:polyisoprenyl-phosphate glycosyltransferase